MLARLYAAVGDTAEVFKLLEQAYEDRSGRFGLAPWPPVFDPNRSDPRYVDLMRRLDLVTPGAQ